MRAVVAKLVGPTLAASAGAGSESRSRRELFNRAMARVDESLTSIPEIEERALAEMDAARRKALERAAAADDLANKYGNLGRESWQTQMSAHADAQRKLAEALAPHSVRGADTLRKRVAKALASVRRVAYLAASRFVIASFLGFFSKERHGFLATHLTTMLV